MSSQMVSPIGTPFSSTIARLGARLEVALLVEDAVVRQVHLAVDGHDAAVGEHRGGVVDVLGLLRDSPPRRRSPASRRASSWSAARRRRGRSSSAAGPRAGSRSAPARGTPRARRPRRARGRSARRSCGRCRGCRPTVGLICASATRSRSVRSAMSQLSRPHPSVTSR